MHPIRPFARAGVCFAAILPLVLMAGLAAPASDGPELRYDRDIRPLLSDRCFRCHGQDATKRRGKLRLDDPESSLADRGGYAAIVPGKPDESELVHRVTNPDPKEVMPPPSSNKRTLSASEQELVKRWIERGAPYEPHWSFVAPTRPPVPEVRTANWSRNAIDRFVLARLESEGVAPSADADRETLLRRLFLDLTGLPPTPEEIDAFLADRTAEAYERVVDRIFSEEPYKTRYAERMATPWLDAARYADTCGIHTDAGRQIWPWRDWLLNAYRDNLPFDRFLTEQLAGDLLPDATEQQRIASGFNRNHVTTDEGGAISEEYLVEYAVDRAATTGSVFLALTLGCARCHEHKFDPISQEEFYSFYAYFNSIGEPGLYSQLPDPDRAFEPFMTVPTAEQERELASMQGDLGRARAELAANTPEEEAQYAEFLGGLAAKSGLAWATSALVAAKSANGATLSIQPDGSALASGANPDRDEHELVLTTEGGGLRLLMVEALADPSLPEGRVGRAQNGNAVLSGVEAEAVALADRTQRQIVHFTWAWADHEQENGDFRVVNVLETRDALGWAVDAHRKPGGRVALLLAEQPFGFDGGTELHVRLQYNSAYSQHVLGRVRLSVGTLDPRACDALPSAVSGWYVAGPFPAESGQAAFDQAFGPEADASLDLARNFGGGNQTWRFDENLRDEKLNDLAAGVNAFYVARRIFAPTARNKVELSLGSDDGFRLFLNGKEVASHRVDRPLSADQERATIELAAGVNVMVMKIANSGGPAGFFQRTIARDGELAGDLVAALLPGSARAAELDLRVRLAWKTAFSPGYRARRERITLLGRQIAEIDAKTPRTMVMEEMAAPRPTFVLARGAYDKADPSRPVERGVPAALGRLPENAPNDRLGLARWMTSTANPLVARVAVNRWWELFFGIGIVRTSEDFGMQGEWPSHPELLDWLAVELHEGGGPAGGAAAGPWDVQHLLRLIVTSSTYRQSSRQRPDVRERDPEDRWLSWFPRRRLTAEQIRDQALYVSGLLVEKFGGPSVKPYQPDGLWNEVAMPASNTRSYVRGEGEDLWRRSLYTYWKRACPPPLLQTFDAPTRESCTIRRASTDTPLQALALWNDEQFVEAARMLAQRTLSEGGVPGGDDARLKRMFRRCTGHEPAADEVALMAGKVAEFRERFAAAPADAEKLLKVGAAPPPMEAKVAPAELAAWTLIANALLSLDATICRS